MLDFETRPLKSIISISIILGSFLLDFILPIFFSIKSIILKS